MFKKYFYLVYLILVLSLTSLGCLVFNNYQTAVIKTVQAQSSTVSLNPSVTYQAMTGWEASNYCKDEPGHSPAFPQYMDELLDKAVNDLGLTRVRLSVGAGLENTQDYYAQWLSGQWVDGQWVDGQMTEYEYVHNPGPQQRPVNDNNDPFSLIPAADQSDCLPGTICQFQGFYFSALDYKMDYVVMPLKQRLQAKGEDLFINFTYVSFRQSTFEHADHPEEYAEFMLAVYQHMQNKYGVVPDAINVILEPDNCPEWNGRRIGQAIAATVSRLEDHDFTPRFIIPSTTNMGNASVYFDSMINELRSHTQDVNGYVAKYIEEISYHRYGGATDANLQAVADRAVQYGINSAMLEHMGSSYSNLHKDLKMGRNSAWSGAYSIAGANTGFDLYRIDDSNPNNPRVIMNSKTKFYRQYFKFIRPGAVRIEATSTNNNFDPLAFINTDNKYVVVVKANSGGSFTIQDLPTGTYGIKYTTSGQYDVDLTDQTVAQGQTLTTNIPSSGVITIYPKSSAPPPQPSITLTKSSNLSSASPNQEITYTIHYHNTSQSPAQSVVITDLIPTGTSYVQGSAQAIPVSTKFEFLPNNTLSWEYDIINGNGEGDLEFKVKVN